MAGSMEGGAVAVASPQHHLSSPRTGASTPMSDGSSRSGAEVYRAIMNTYHRRLRKPQPMATNDAAGLLCGTRYHGRGTPLKGHGSPPPDNFEAEYRNSKRVVPGRSYTAQKSLLKHHTEPLNMSMDSAMFALLASGQVRPGSAPFGVRPSKKVCDISFRHSLEGAGLVAIGEAPPFKRMLKPGPFPQAATKPRVMAHAGDVCPPSESEAAARAFLDTRWRLQRSAASIPEEQEPEFFARPATAPPRNEARRHYQTVNIKNNLDVFEYPNCKMAGRLSPSRTPQPQLLSPTRDEVHEVYTSAHDDYVNNRVKGLVSRTSLYYKPSA